MAARAPTFQGPALNLFGNRANERYDDATLAALADVPLEKLTLYRQSITKLPPLQPRHLRELALADMRLPTLAGIETLAALSELWISRLPALDLATELSRIAELPDLATLHLHHVATVPAALARLPSLVSLALHLDEKADLEETFEVLANCPTLRTLELAYVSGEDLPKSIAKLQQLRRFEVRGAARLPDELFALVDLEELEVRERRCRKDLDPRIGTLRNLRKLDIGDTRLRSLPETIGDLAALRQLSIPWNCKKVPASLAKLTLDSFSGPIEVRDLLTLNPPTEPLEDRVWIADPDRIPPSFGDPLELTIYLPETERAWPELDALERITDVRLDVPNLADPLRRLASKPRLRTLHLAGKHATFPEELCELVQLTELRLASSEAMYPDQIGSLTALPKHFGRLTGLVSLNIGSSQLTTLPSSIGELVSLESLYITGNQLAKLPSAIGKLAKLKTLALFQTKQLTGLPPELVRCTSLEHVRIRDSRLGPADLLVLAKLPALRHLDLMLALSPSLDELLEALAATRLEQLVLSDYDLKALPRSIGKLTTLRRLEVPYGIDIPDELARCTALRYVSNVEATIKPNLPPGRWKRGERSSRYWYERTD